MRCPFHLGMQRRHCDQHPCALMPTQSCSVMLSPWPAGKKDWRRGSSHGSLPLCDRTSVVQGFSLYLSLTFLSPSYLVTDGLVNSLSLFAEENTICFVTVAFCETSCFVTIAFCGVDIPAVTHFQLQTLWFVLLCLIFFFLFEMGALPQPPHAAIVCHSRLQPHFFFF